MAYLQSPAKFTQNSDQCEREADCRITNTATYIRCTPTTIFLDSHTDTSTTMIKVCSEFNPFLILLTPLLDLEYEEERGCSGKEEAKDECCSDPGAKRLRSMAFT